MSRVEAVEATDWETSQSMAEDVETPPVPPEASAPPVTPPETPPVAQADTAAADTTDDADDESVDTEPTEPNIDRDRKGRFRRHRARSQQASPEDVPRIKAMTKRIRTLEQQLATTRTTDAPKPVIPPAVPEPPRVEKAAFTDPEPTREQFFTEADPEAAYYRAMARWDRKHEAWEAEQASRATAATEGHTQALKAAERDLSEVQTAWNAREAAFKQATPDYDTVVTGAPHAKSHLTQLMNWVLLTHDKGPELVYYLAQHPSVFDEAQLLTVSSPVTEHTVAHLQRWLQSRMQAASTGSAAPRPPVTLVPRPPNPVRTGPLKTGATLPGDDASLEDHEKAFHLGGPSRRRRRHG